MQVFLNGERLPIKSFQEYVGLYIANKEAPRVYERISDRWEVCVLASEGQFHQARMHPRPVCLRSHLASPRPFAAMCWPLRARSIRRAHELNISCSWRDQVICTFC